MYYFDKRPHHMPHVHVKYQDQEAVIAIPEGEVLEGTLKSNKLRLVQAWIEIHRYVMRKLLAPCIIYRKECET